MGKGHRDNTAARKKRGPAAFAKKAARRAPDERRAKCRVCGTLARVARLEDRMCPPCRARLGLAVGGQPRPADPPGGAG
jgi:rubrerythrin